MAKEKKSFRSFAAGMLTGGIIGSVLAVLYTPKSGKAVRRDISHKKDELKYNAEKYIENAKEKMTEYVYEGKEKAEQIMEDAKMKANNLVKETGSYFLKGKDKISKKDE